MIEVNLKEKECSFEDGTYELTLSNDSTIRLENNNTLKILIKDLNNNVRFVLKDYSKLELDFVNANESVIDIDLLDRAEVNIKYIASKESNVKLNINLIGYESKAYVNSLVVNKDVNSSIETNVNHLAKNTVSDVSSYGVSIANSTIVFDQFLISSSDLILLS